MAKEFMRYRRATRTINPSSAGSSCGPCSGSQMIPKSTTASVMDREEIKRRLSENSLKWKGPDENAVRDEYSVPNKSRTDAAAVPDRSQAAVRKKKHVSFDAEGKTTASQNYDVPPSRESALVRAATQHSKKTAISAVDNMEYFTAPPRIVSSEEEGKTARPDYDVPPNRETLVRVTTQHTKKTPISAVDNMEYLTASPKSTKQVPAPQVQRRNSETGALDAIVDVYEDDSGEVRGVVYLSTLRQTHVPRIKVRVICLIDVSGSMLLKGDRRKTRSKLTIMKNMAVDIIDALDDDEDFVGVMTFGEESKVICPLTKMSSASREEVKQKVSKLDEDGEFSTVTNLSSAVLQAVDMLTQAQQDESLLYRNCIIVFSDGEVNAGEVEPKNLVHVVREKIRECSMPRDILADLWVNISCVTTGSNFSQSLYLLSKLCGSDAYFFVDAARNHPEAEMLVPLMLRKTACAQMVSVSIKTKNGASLTPQRCSQEYSIRTRRGRSVAFDKNSLTYFVHDMPVGSQKTFTLSLDLSGVKDKDCDDFLSVDVQYVDALGVLHEVKKSLGLQEVVSMKKERERCLEIMVKEGISEMRQLLQATCRNVANLLEDVSPDDDNDDNESVVWAIKDGLKDLQKLKEDYGRKFEGCGKASQHKERLDEFAKAIQDNMNKLRQIVQQNAKNRQKGWQYAKAMSSAVVRELPTVSNVLAQPRVVCPLPEAKDCASRRTHALSLYIFGGDTEEGIYADRGAVLHSAVSDVAKTLADVLKLLEPTSSEA